jgi:hypothetical protein
MNSYIQPNFATAEAVAADVAAAADVSVPTAAAYFASGVTFRDDAEGDITVKAVESGEKKSDVLEASSPAVASTASVASAAAVAYAAAVAAPAVASGQKNGVSGLPISVA